MAVIEDFFLDVIEEMTPGLPFVFLIGFLLACLSFLFKPNIAYVSKRKFFPPFNLIISKGNKSK